MFTKNVNNFKIPMTDFLVTSADKPQSSLVLIMSVILKSGSLPLGNKDEEKYDNHLMRWQI